MTTIIEQETDLGQVANTYRAALPINGAFEFSLTPLDRVGQPLWAAGLWGDPVTFFDGFGYGETQEAAEVSAWGEVAENFHATHALRRMHRRYASYQALLSEGIDAIDPVSLCLDAGCDYDPGRTLCWVEARRYPTHEPVLIPVEAAAASYQDIAPDADRKSWLMTPVTNGLGAGITFDQALSHGLCELIQRDGDSVTFRALDRGIAIELDDVRSGSTRRLLQRLAGLGIRVIPKIASTDFGIPVVYVVGADEHLEQAPFGLMLSACGEAAHPDRERALAKALQEFISSRARKRFMHGPLRDVAAVAPASYMDRLFSSEPGGDESRALQSVSEWVGMSKRDFFELIRDPVLSVKSRVMFSSLPTCDTNEAADAAALLKLLTERLSKNGLEIIYVPLSSDNDIICAVKAIVPGLEVETMSYGRIGRRNVQRLLDRDLGLVGIGKPAPGASPIRLSEEDRTALGGPAWLDRAAVDHVVGRLYGLYREPNGHTVARRLENR